MSTKSMLVQGIQITISSQNAEDFISLTDMVKGFEGGSSLIEAWLRNKDTVQFLGAWERINNVNFNSPEFEGIRTEAGLNKFTLSVKKWNEAVNGIGLQAKTGRYGGTYAHKDIAFEFGSWLSPEFKLYLIKEFQRLKEEEANRNSLEFQVNRELAKINYRVHTDAIKEHIIPTVAPRNHGFTYANEAEMINAVVFGKKAQTWRLENPDAVGNQRDNGTAKDNAVIAHIESLNSLYIEQGKPIEQRFTLLQDSAKKYRASIENSRAMNRLEEQSKPILGIDKK